MFIPLAYTVAIALFASLFLSIFVIPGLCGLVLKPASGKGEPDPAVGQKSVPAADLHQPAEPVAGPRRVRWPWSLGAVALIPRLGSEFMPVMDEGAFDMDIQMLPGVSLSEAAAVTGQAQDRLMKFPELQHAVSKTGQTGISLEARGLDRSAFQGNFQPREKWRTGLTKERADRPDAGRPGGHPRHRLQLQPADPVPDRRAGRRHPGPGDREALRGRPGRPPAARRTAWRTYSRQSPAARTSSWKRSPASPTSTSRWTGRRSPATA